RSRITTPTASSWRPSLESASPSTPCSTAAAATPSSSGVGAGRSTRALPRTRSSSSPPSRSESRFSGSRRERVAPVDEIADAPPARRGRQARVAFDRRHLIRELRVLDRIAKPLRVVTAAQVIEPRLVVDALRDRVEHHEVVRAQVQPPVAPAEVEALVRPELAVGVLAAMAASGNAAGRHGEPLRAGVIAKPNEPLPLLLRRRPDLGLGGPEGAREALERRHRVCP